MCWSRSSSPLIGDLRYPLICQLEENSTFRLQFEQVYLMSLIWLREGNGHMTLLGLIKPLSSHHIQSQKHKAIKQAIHNQSIKRVHTRSKSRKTLQIKRIHHLTLETQSNYSQVMDLSRYTNKEIERVMMKLDRRSGVEKMLDPSTFASSSSFFSSSCSFALFRSLSVLSEVV